MDVEYPSGLQLWIELAPILPGPAKRVLVLLHGASSSPELFAPVAIAWQLKFPSAVAFVLQAPIAVKSQNGRPERFSWLVPSDDLFERSVRTREAAEKLALTLALIEKQSGISANQTAVIGFGEGASLALEIARSDTRLADIVVSYAGQLSRSLSANERISSRSVHLLHGELDSIVTPDKSERAFRQIKRIHENVTFDVLVDGTHVIDQDSVIVGTTRAMQSIFQGRRPKSAGFLH